MVEVGISSGDTVLVHTGTNNLLTASSKEPEDTYGMLKYSRKITDMLIGLVGPKGTILMPTDPAGAGRMRSLNDGIFDYRKTPTYRGIVAELFRRRKDVIRSVNPWQNVTGWGKHAEYLLMDHEKSTPYAMDIHSPWFKLNNVKGKVVIIGRRFEVNSAVHVVEAVHHNQYPRGIYLDKPYVFKYIDRNNVTKQMNIMLHASAIWSDKSVNDFMDYLNEIYNIYKIVNLGKTFLISYDSTAQYDAIYNEMKKGVYFCDFILNK